MGVHAEPLPPAHSYIWQHIEIGYVQGMCDLLAPLLVILDDGECVLPARGLGVQLPSYCGGGWSTSLCESEEAVRAGAQKTCLVSSSRSS